MTDPQVADELAGQADACHGAEATSPHLSKSKQQHYRICNPRPGGPGYTSQKRAYELVERGIAVFSGLKAIEFLPEPTVRIMRQFTLQEQRARLTSAEIDREINANRNGVVYWNGKTGHGQVHLPGHVIS